MCLLYELSCCRSGKIELINFFFCRFCEVRTIELEGGRDRVGENTGFGKKARVHEFVDAESLS